MDEPLNHNQGVNMFKKFIAASALSVAVVALPATANAVTDPSGPPNRHPLQTWTDIHTGDAQYVCDKVYRGKYNKKGHKIPKWKRVKYVNCHVVYVG